MFAQIHNRIIPYIVALMAVTALFGLLLETIPQTVYAEDPAGYICAPLNPSGAPYPVDGPDAECVGRIIPVDEAGNQAGEAIYPEGSGGILADLGNAIGNLILTLGAFIAGAGGWLLDGAIARLVLGMGELLKSTGMGAVVNDVWGIIRDFSNLLFIFGFIYVGIRTILEGVDSANTKRFLAQLVIAALLINFSLFFAKAVIDVSNVFAVEVQQLLVGDGQTNVAWGIAKQAGLAGFYNDVPAETLAHTTTDGSITFYIMGFLFLLIIGFVFAAAAVMLIIRFVALILIMIFSPLIFAATLFPQTAKYSGTLISMLFRYAFFAPVFLFLVYISLRILKTSGPEITQGNDFANALASTGQITSFAVFLQFAIAIVFLIVSLKAAQSMSLVGGDHVVKVGNWARGQVQGLAGRGTVGWVGDKWAQGREKKGKSTQSTFSRVALTAASAKFGSGASKQQVREAEEKAGRIRSRNTQVANVTDAVRAGATSGADDRTQITMERAVAGASTEQLVAMLKKNKPGTREGNAIIASMSASQFDNVMKVKDEELDDGTKANIAKERATAVGQKVQTAGGIGKANMAQLKTLGSERIEQDASQLTVSQIDDIKKSNDFTDTEKARILNAWKVATINAFAQNPESTLQGIKNEDAAKLPKEIFTEERYRDLAAPHLTPGIMQQLKKTLSQSERAPLRQAVGARPEDDSGREWLDSPQGREF